MKTREEKMEEARRYAKAYYFAHREAVLERQKKYQEKRRNQNKDAELVPQVDKGLQSESEKVNV